MIPYQELVAALTTWRARQGLPTGQSDYLGEPLPMAPTALPEAATYGDAVQYAEFSDADILDEASIDEVDADDIAEEVMEQPVESGELFADDSTDMVDMATEQQAALDSEPTVYDSVGADEPGDFYQKVDDSADLQDDYGDAGGPSGYPSGQDGYTTADDAYPGDPQAGYDSAPAFETPAYEAVADPAAADPAAAYEAPAYETPAYEAPAYEAPAYETPAYDAAALDGPPDPFAEAAPLVDPADDPLSPETSEATLDVDDDLIMAEDDIIMAEGDLAPPPLPAGPPPLEPPPADDDGSDPQKGW